MVTQPGALYLRVQQPCLRRSRQAVRGPVETCAPDNFSEGTGDHRLATPFMEGAPSP